MDTWRWLPRAVLGPGRTEATEDLRKLGPVPGCQSKRPGGRLTKEMALFLHLSRIHTLRNVT